MLGAQAPVFSVNLKFFLERAGSLFEALAKGRAERFESTSFNRILLKSLK